MALKDRIESIILETGKRKKDFAAELKISPQYITKLLAGERNLSRRMAEAIEEKFGYSARWILTGEGEPKVPTKEETDTVTEPARLSLERLKAMNDNVLDAVVNLIDEVNKK